MDRAPSCQDSKIERTKLEGYKEEQNQDKSIQHRHVHSLKTISDGGLCSLQRRLLRVEFGIILEES